MSKAPPALVAFQELLGHEEITTTEIYLHVATGANGFGVTSPLDAMGSRATSGASDAPGFARVLEAGELAEELAEELAASAEPGEGLAADSVTGAGPVAVAA